MKAVGDPDMRKSAKAPVVRNDVVYTNDATLSNALKAAKSAAKEGAERAPQIAGATLEEMAEKSPDSTQRFINRSNFVEPVASDPTGLERVIDESDLTSINYLDRGRRIAAGVCRIRVPAAGGEWYGTGFLVGPRLLITNNHVLASMTEASQGEAEFDYEHDIDGVLKSQVSFNLCPHEVFITDTDLDVTLVGINPLSDGGVPIDRYGWLPLLPPSGKAVHGEWVTIIQHPNGGPKQISIRSNQILKLDDKSMGKDYLDKFIHYRTDTEPGSSGSPVVNDQWQVVAVHHKAIAEPQADATKPPKFIGNEGVRVSAIYNWLERHRLEDPNAQHALDRLEGALGFPPTSPASSGTDIASKESDGSPYRPGRWPPGPDIGYDPDFFPKKSVNLSDIYKKFENAGDLAPLLDGSGSELKYRHFSVVVHKARRFALLTAVNINVSEGKLQKPGKRPSTWRQDGRMAPVYQPDGAFYEKARGSDKVQFSRGHLVRRFDPCWGDTPNDGLRADEDTFHYTNAAPQHQAYNDIDWGNLEDYVLAKALTSEKKMTVFQGPIFRDNDPWYGRDRTGGPWQIPLSYWKIAVLEKEKDQIVAAAFIVGQTQYVQALYEGKIFAGLKPYRIEDIRSRKIQTTIKTIEDETKLDFSAIREFDSQSALESTRQTRWINSFKDIAI